MLDAAAVEVHRHPVRGLLRAERQMVVPRIAEAEEVPRRIDERVHRIGFAAGGAAATRTRDVDPLGHLAKRRIAAARERRDFRQLNWQLLVRDWDDAVRRAMDDGNRRAPVALPGN